MSFVQALLYYASPTLCGIKPASIFSYKETEFSQIQDQVYDLQQEFSKYDRWIVPVFNENRARDILLFIYDAQLLSNTLENPRMLSYLEQKGYDVKGGTKKIIAEVLRRVSVGTAFPHEIGIFLGYPLEDVIAFERNKGKHSKLTGYWQVYGNIEKACAVMRAYKSCSSFCCSLLERGLRVPFICRNFLNSHKQLEAIK